MHIYQYSCHRKENVRINKHGQLEIIANANKQASGSRFLFNGGKLSSTKGWLYGRFEIRAKLPEGNWLRPVFLLRPLNSRYSGNWLDNGQINILVYNQQHSAIIAGIHYRMSPERTYMGRKLYTNRNITNSFNRYSVEWTEHSIRWFFNDFPFFEHNVTKPFDQEFGLVIQLGVGGPEFDNQGTVMSEVANIWRNNRFLIDYIKVYQKLTTETLLRSRSSASHSTQSNQLLNVFLIKYLFLLLIINWI